MRKFEAYPKWKYKEGESARLVQTSSEEADLGDTWFDKPDNTNHSVDIEKAAASAHAPGYEPIEFPKWRYAKEIPGGKLVSNEAEQEALEDAYDSVTWYDKPDFTNHGEDSTDTESPTLYTNATNSPPFDVLTGQKALLKPVPEMKQGKAAQKASAIAETEETKDDEDGEDSEDDNADDSDPVEEANEDGGITVGESQNNFDHAEGVNPGDAAPEGENPNGPTGKVTKNETEKQTAEEQKKPEAKPKKAPAKKKDADDLL